MTKENKIYFIEVYENEFGTELIGQEEYPSLLAAYDAAKDIPEMYSGFNFDHLEIVDSEDLNRVYYTFSTFNGGKIHEAELRELINNRNNAAKIEKIDAAEAVTLMEVKVAIENREEQIDSEKAEIANRNEHNTEYREKISDSEKKFYAAMAENNTCGMTEHAGNIKYYLSQISDNDAIKAELKHHIMKLEIEVSELSNIFTEAKFIVYKKKNIATKNERIAREEKDFYAGLEENCLDKMIWAAREIGELLDQIESEMEDLAGHYRYLEKYKKELRKYIPIKAKAKVAEILNRPRKKIIDWSGTFAEMKISEILSLQKDFKKYLKLGQIELAENIFSMLKTLCKNYRKAA